MGIPYSFLDRFQTYNVRMQETGIYTCVQVDKEHGSYFISTERKYFEGLSKSSRMGI